MPTEIELAESLIRSRNLQRDFPKNDHARNLRENAWQDLVTACGGDEAKAHQLAISAVENDIDREIEDFKKKL